MTGLVDTEAWVQFCEAALSTILAQWDVAAPPWAVRMARAVAELEDERVQQRRVSDLWRSDEARPDGHPEGWPRDRAIRLRD